MQNQHAHRVPVLRIVRRICQLIAFLLAPGFFATIFDAVGSLVMAAAGRYNGDLLVPAMTVLVVFIVNVLFGRFFCGFFCSFGAMGDFLWFLSRKVLPRKGRIPQRVDTALKLLKYLILAFLVTAVWILGAVSIPATASPWTIFGMFASVGNWAPPAYLLTAGGLMLAVIIVASFFAERFFCRYLCPLGALFSLTSRFRLFNIEKERNACGNCRACTRNCSMGIDLSSVDTVRSGECINCMACTEICPRRNAHTSYAPALVSALSVFALAAACYGGFLFNSSAASLPVSGEAISQSASAENTVSGNTSAAAANSTQASSTGNTKAAAGSTQASSTGNTKAAAGSTQASPTGNTKAAANSTQASSTGNTKAAGSSATAAASTLPSASVADIPESITAAVSTGNYTDGTYSGSGTGFRGTTKVNVTVSGGKISRIDIVSYQDNQPYFSRAQSGVVSEILNSQDVSVDAVSGATFSSNGIMEAVANALGVEYTSPNSSMSGSRKR